MKRRLFLKTTSQLCLLLASSQILYSKTKETIMEYKMQALPFAENALEPHISTQTVQTHYGKHQLAYLNKLNDALASVPSFQAPENLEDLLKDLKNVPDSIRPAVINNGGGVYNHVFYWDSLSPSKTKMSENLEDKIIKSFGSVQNFKDKFISEASIFFGSGWVWLCEDKNGDLVILNSINQNAPIMGELLGFDEGLNPLLTIDLWEHAYYLDRKNLRPDYINSFWDVINWDKVSSRLKN